MIKGYVFSNQLASNDIDSMVFRKMLDYNDGVLNGMELSNTNSSITIGEGNILVAGRPIGVIGSETVTAGTDTAYCKLVVEIDLSQTATVSTFEQVSFKIIKSTTASIAEFINSADKTIPIAITVTNHSIPLTLKKILAQILLIK